jgi:predicted O-linked N-acetylglucosamine transferase (SPINDLY family)
MNTNIDPFHEAEAFHRRGDIAGAETWTRRALAQAPQEPAILNLLGVLADGRFDLVAATTAYGRALARDPYNIMIFGNLAGTLSRYGLVEPAVRIGRRTLALAPADQTAHNNTAQALKAGGFIEESFVAYRRTISIAPSSTLHSNLLFSLSYDDRISSEMLFAEYRRWEDVYARPYYRPDRRHANVPDPDRRIVVGYVSQDFRDHPLGRILVELFENHDRERVQVNGYASIRFTDDLTERCRRSSGVWRQVTGLSDHDLAEQIRADGVDVLVIVGGHSAHNRLLVTAHRPAPIQVSLDDVSTSGLEAVDYWISDPLLHPADGKGWSERFTETISRVPCFFLQPPDELAPPVQPLPALRTGGVTFGSFSNPAKLTPTTIAAWAAAMRAVPNSRIGLKYVDWYSDASVQRRVLGMFAAEGIGAHRIVFGGGDHTRTEQLALWNDIDIALDPFPFGGWTSSFEALWMGVPVLTLLGERFAGRVGYAVMERLGLGEFVARTPAEFGTIAAAVTRDLDALAKLRFGLRERLRRSPLCDGKIQAGYFEAAYRDMWLRWCRSQAETQASR